MQSTRGQRAVRQVEIRSLEAVLLEARLRAGSIHKPVLAYFVDMAIAELQTIAPVVDETPCLQDGRKLSKVVQFADSPAKGALLVR